MSRQSQPATAATVDQVIGAITRNPEGLLLLAAGAALLMRKSASAFTASTAGQQRSPGVDALKKAASETKDYASDMAERTRDTVGSVASSASEYASEARRAVGEQSERVIQNAQSAFQGTVERVLQDRPLMVAIAGLAAGVAVATAFPATDFEKDTLGPVGEQVSDAASRVGDQVKEAASNASDALKSAAEKRGLNADGLKEVATEVAESFGRAMKGETGNAPRGSSGGR
jgi:ElaB/YqjD/DUF883 family membrane-anchored ribosome-binding protein